MHYALDRTSLTPEGNIVRYQIDTRSSTFKVRAFATGLLSAFGHSPTVAIRDFSGEVKFDPETLSSGSTLVRIKATSLKVADDIGDKDRQDIERQMYETVLEVSQYPEIVYECQNVTINRSTNGQLEATLLGKLTLHGVTQDQAVSARISVIGDSLRATGDFSVSQSAFGIKEVTAVGGTIRLKDELKATFEMVARKSV